MAEEQSLVDRAHQRQTPVDFRLGFFLRGWACCWASAVLRSKTQQRGVVLPPSPRRWSYREAVSQQSPGSPVVRRCDSDGGLRVLGNGPQQRGFAERGTQNRAALLCNPCGVTAARRTPTQGARRSAATLGFGLKRLVHSARGPLPLARTIGARQFAGGGGGHLRPTNRSQVRGSPCNACCLDSLPKIATPGP